jgi:FkbM family methyltransferase
MELKVTSYSKDFPVYDLSIIREVPREYASVVPDMKGAVVLDIGGHIGCFSVLAVNAGCKRVVCIEPGKPSILHARKNLAQAVKAGLCEVHHAGVTADPKQHELILRYFTDAGSMAGAKTVSPENTMRLHWRGKPYTYERVQALHFGQLLADYKPQVLKLDCEGVEYPCLDSLKTMPKHVQVFIGEWHKTAGRGGINGYLRCTERLRSWGFTPDREPNLKIERNEKGEATGSNQFFIRPIAWRR